LQLPVDHGSVRTPFLEQLIDRGLEWIQ